MAHESDMSRLRRVTVTIRWKRETVKQRQDSVRFTLGRRVFEDTRVRQVEVVRGTDRVTFETCDPSVWSCGDDGSSTLDVVITFGDGVPIDTVVGQWDELRLALTDNNVCGTSTLWVNGEEVVAVPTSGELVFRDRLVLGACKGAFYDIVSGNKEF